MTTFLKHADTYVPGACTLAGQSFTSPDIYAEELEKFFYRHSPRESLPAAWDRAWLKVLGQSA